LGNKGKKGGSYGQLRLRHGVYLRGGESGVWSILVFRRPAVEERLMSRLSERSVLKKPHLRNKKGKRGANTRTRDDSSACREKKTRGRKMKLREKADGGTLLRGKRAWAATF